MLAGHVKPDGMAPVRVVAAHELVLEQIRTSILLGRYRPGDSLPPERSLAEFLGVSRTTVREAVAVLVDEGLVEVKRGRGGGLFVRGASVTEQQLKRIIKQHRDQLQGVFEFRETVEPACAYLAAQRRTGADLREMKRLHAKMESLKGSDGRLPTNPEDSAHFHSLDTDFHLAIARAAHSPWLEQAALTGRIEMFRPVGSLFNSLDTTGDYLHQQIVEAIEEQDAPAARKFMAQHICTTHDVVEGWIDEAETIVVPAKRRSKSGH